MRVPPGPRHPAVGADCRHHLALGVEQDCQTIENKFELQGSLPPVRGEVEQYQLEPG